MPHNQPHSDAETQLVIATDVRFWHRSTGAQRRIYSLASHLATRNVKITVLFVGPLTDPGGGYSANQERQAIATCPFDVISLIEDWTPQGLWQRGLWKIKCIANWLHQSFSKNSSAGPQRPQPASKYLDDFANPLMAERFQDMVERLTPDAVIVEYVTLGYLVPNHPSFETKGPHYLIDTHDLLSERYRQFKKYGFEHWIRITRDEETAVLQKFDTVIAIQEQEAEEFQSMCGMHPPVVVAGYPADPSLPIPTSPEVGKPVEFTLGYFGSNNPSNSQAIDWFMTEVWPQVIAQQPKVSLLIAGSVCDAIDKGGDQPNVVFQSQIESLPSLYERFKIAINPVQFGTGLKIKNQEALAFGKPLIVTESGAAGMITTNMPSPIFITKNSQQMQQAILDLATDETAIHQASKVASQYVADYLSATRVYESLVQRLQTFPNSPHDCSLSESVGEL